MIAIRISKEVWQEIANRGKFGETEDDVLRRVFNMRSQESDQKIGLPQPSAGVTAQSGFATNRMHARVYPGKNCEYLKVRFHGSGKEQYFDLPLDKSDKNAIRTALNNAHEFGENQGATRGQLNAIRKALTDAEYHLTK